MGMNNWVANVAEEGTYDIVITFNPEAAEADRITCSLTKTDLYPHVYTVAGTPTKLFKNEWDPTYERNDMEKGADGIYTWHEEGVVFYEGEDIYFKVVQDHSWDKSWPSENRWFHISEYGVYCPIITFNPKTGEITFDPNLVVIPD